MRLALSIFAENLPKASEGKSILRGLGEVLPNPFAIITVLHNDDNCTPTVLGQTEVLAGVTSPIWTKKLPIGDFALGRPMHIVVTVYDKRKNGGGGTSNVPLGSVLFEVGAVVGSVNSILAKEMKRDTDSIIGVRIEEKPTPAVGTLHVQLRGCNLKNKDGLGLGFAKSDPFYEIQRLQYSNKRPNVAAWETIYTSNVMYNDLNPIWPETYIPMEDIIGNNNNSNSNNNSYMHEKLRMLVLDHDEGSFSDKIGEVQFTIHQLMHRINKTASSIDPQRVDPGKSFLLKKGMKERGLILVIAAEIIDVDATTTTGTITDSMAAMNLPSSEQLSTTVEEDGTIEVVEELSEEEVQPPSDAGRTEEYSFIDYVSGGCELRVIIGIDVSSSSNHSSDYEQALVAICNMLSRYDSDQKFPMYGIGGGDGGQGNCFRFGGGGSGKEEADGVDGIINLYRETIQEGSMVSTTASSSSKRDFSAVIKQAGADAKANLASKQSYSILLLFTDGSPDDIDATMAALKEVDDAPLSIVIVGVGENNYALIGSKRLEELSNDTQCGQRDKVRMVHFSGELKSDHDKLTAAALDHIPKQLEAYFVSKGIAPQVPKFSGEDDDFGNFAFEPYDARNDISVPIEFNPATGSVKVTQNIKAPRLAPRSASSRSFSRGGILKKVGMYVLRNYMKKNGNVKVPNFVKQKMNEFLGDKVF